MAARAQASARTTSTSPWARGAPVATAALAFALLPAALFPAELVGRVEVVSHGRPVPGEASRAVVSFRPDGPVELRPSAGPPQMATHGKAFDPRVLAVVAGSTVSFPNRDPILHNIFSVSDPYRFDLGLYGRGEAQSVTFDRPGVVRVYCNVHQGMVGYVLVLDTPYFTSPDESGRFRLTGLREGSGTLTVWHEQAAPWSRHIQVPAAPAEARLELTKPRIPPHLDKFGRSYRRFGRDRYDGH